MSPDAIWTADEAVRATGGRSRADWVAQGVSIDSRTVEFGDMFIALEGPNQDGHAYVEDALKAGAAVAVVHRIPEGMEYAADQAAPLLIVDDTQKALEDLAVFARARSGAHICAVTGSVGKTGAKEALREALERSGNTHVNVASYNNLWGVPLSLARMRRDALYAVFEIGMNHAGEITPLVKMVRPHVVIVTTVEPAHLEYFADIEAIADAKAEIFSGLEPGGTAILNYDNNQFARLEKAALEVDAKVVSFGAEPGADVQLKRLALHPNCSCVSARLLDQEATYKIGMAGRHWAINSLAVLAAVQVLGADVGLATLALAGMEAPAGRGRRCRIEGRRGAFDLIDDSYNASPASVRAALSVLSGATVGEGGRRIAVLGEMKELGDASPQLHADLAAEFAAGNIDQVFCVGEFMARLAAALPLGVDGVEVANAERAAPLVAAAIRAGDVVLVKGSLASRMKLVIDALRALESPRQAANG
jgi:UDP-N-acetylmuramoyl-tripeptide--D-alanyl-D-alanine ligase